MGMHKRQHDGIKRKEEVKREKRRRKEEDVRGRRQRDWPSPTHAGSAYNVTNDYTHGLAVYLRAPGVQLHFVGKEHALLLTRFQLPSPAVTCTGVQHGVGEVPTTLGLSLALAISLHLHRSSGDASLCSLTLLEERQRVSHSLSTQQTGWAGPQGLLACGHTAGNKATWLVMDSTCPSEGGLCARGGGGACWSPNGQPVQPLLYKIGIYAKEVTC